MAFKQTFAGIVKSLVKNAVLTIKGDASIINDNTGDQTDATLPFSVIATNNASTKKHGFLRKLTGNVTYYLNANGEWTIPPGTGAPLSEITLLSGVIDGVNTVFVWANAPLMVYYNGQLLKEGVGYILSGTTTTLTNAPFTGEYVWAYGNY